MIKFGAEPIACLFLITSFVRYTLIQNLVLQKICLYSYELAFCSSANRSTFDQDITDAAYRFNILSSLIELIPSVISSAVIGALSDQYDRRVVILIPLLGMFFATMNDVVQATFKHLSPYYLLLSNAIMGVTGSFPSVISTSFAFTATLAPQGKLRSQRISIMEGAMGIGGTIGYFSMGPLLKAWDFDGTFLFLGFLHAVCIFYVIGIKLLQNGEAIENYTPSTSQSLREMLVVDLMGAIRVLYAARDRFIRWALWLILFALSIEAVVFSGSMNVTFYYVQNRFGWTPGIYGYFKGIGYALSSLMMFFVYPLFRALRIHDCYLSAWGMITKAIGYVILALATTTTAAFSATIPYAFSRFVVTGIRATISSHLVNQNEQGRAFALVGIIQALASIIAAPIFNELMVYAAKSTVPGAAFFVFAFALFVTAVIMILVFRLILKSTLINDLDGSAEGEHPTECDPLH